MVNRRQSLQPKHIKVLNKSEETASNNLKVSENLSSIKENSTDETNNENDVSQKSEEFKIGDIVWAKTQSYPHWPAVIEGILDETSDQSSIKTKNKRKSIKSKSSECKYYVKFFGDGQSHAYIEKSKIKPYDCAESGELRSGHKRGASIQSKLLVSIREADSARDSKLNGSLTNGAVKNSALMSIDEELLLIKETLTKETEKKVIKEEDKNGNEEKLEKTPEFADNNKIKNRRLSLQPRMSAIAATANITAKNQRTPLQEERRKISLLKGQAFDEHFDKTRRHFEVIKSIASDFNQALVRPEKKNSGKRARSLANSQSKSPVAKNLADSEPKSKKTKLELKLTPNKEERKSLAKSKVSKNLENEIDKLNLEYNHPSRSCSPISIDLEEKPAKKEKINIEIKLKEKDVFEKLESVSLVIDLNDFEEENSDLKKLFNLTFKKLIKIIEEVNKNNVNISIYDISSSNQTGQTNNNDDRINSLITQQKTFIKKGDKICITHIKEFDDLIKKNLVISFVTTNDVKSDKQKQLVQNYYEKLLRTSDTDFNDDFYYITLVPHEEYEIRLHYFKFLYNNGNFIEAPVYYKSSGPNSDESFQVKFVFTCCKSYRQFDSTKRILNELVGNDVKRVLFQAKNIGYPSDMVNRLKANTLLDYESYKEKMENFIKEAIEEDTDSIKRAFSNRLEQFENDIPTILKCLKEVFNSDK